MIPIIWHSRKGKTIETVKDKWLPGLGERDGDAQEIFRAVKILCMIL